MPPRKKTPPGPPPLTDADVADIAFRVKGGDTPRVVVRSGSAALPAGTRGNVIRIGKPSEGEYIVVRLGRDEVPFAPAELSLPTRRGAKAAPAPAPAPKKTAAAASRPARASARSSAKATKATPAKSAAAKATKSAPTKTSTPQRPTTSADARSRGATRTSKRATRRGKGRSPQPLTVTLRFADSRWTVEAQRGSRRITRATALRPGAVSAFAEHVDEQAVRDALVETVESCRSVVEEQAAALRAELQAAEAALREYDARRK